MLIFTLVDDLELELNIENYEIDLEIIDINEDFNIVDETTWEINDGC